MEASPPLSNAGPRKKTQSKVASEQALAWSGLPIVLIRPLEDANYEGHSLSMLHRIAAALNSEVEVRLVPLKIKKSKRPG